MSVQNQRLTVVVGTVALVLAVCTVGFGPGGPAATTPAVLLPALFVVAGMLGPIWSADPFTCRMLTLLGAAHLVALALSAMALRGVQPSSLWHAVSQCCSVAGFALLLPLASAYPSGPGDRRAWWSGSAVLVLPVAAAQSAPTPTVLQPAVVTVSLGPIVSILPSWVAPISAAVFLVPLAAVGIAVVRSARGDRETRGRLGLPLVALIAYAVLLAVSAVLPAAFAPAATAVVLVASPLIPAGLIAGSRPLETPLDPRPPLAPPTDSALLLLTPREREVLEAMARGESNAAVARTLHMSLSAVEKHTTSIFGKLSLAADSTTHRRVAAVVAYGRAVSGGQP